MEYMNLGNARNATLTNNGSNFNLQGWGSGSNHRTYLNSVRTIYRKINAIGKRYILIWMGFLVFTCITQFHMLLSAQRMHEQKMRSVKEYFQSGKGKIEDIFEKRAYLTHDRDLLSIQENDKNGTLIPHEHEWVYVSSQYEDKYVSSSKLSQVPVRLLNASENNSKISCTDNKKRSFSDLLICNSRTENLNPFLVVATTIYPQKDKLFIFRNIINMWSDFKPNDVLPVMYISDLEDFKKEKTYISLLNYACSKGWMVLLAPKCNNNSIPVFNEMVQTLVLQFPNAQWHGYANGDIVFDKSLVSTLKFLTTASKYIHVSVAIGRRYNIRIPEGYEIKNHDQYVKWFFDNSPSLDDSSQADYFFTRTGTYDWRKVPPFIVGRIVFDSWLIYDSIATDKKIIDITESIRAGHQYNIAQPHYFNSHDSASTDSDYNLNILRNNNISIHLSLSYTSCTSLKTILVDEQKVSENKRTIENQEHWILENMNDAWCETNTLYNMGDPFIPRVHTIPSNTSVYVEAIATRYGVYEADEVWKNKKALFETYPKLGIKPDRERFLKICRNHGKNARRQLTILNIVNKLPATKWELWFRKQNRKH